MKTQKNIPLIIFEEHHEAFLIWNYAIRQRWIPYTGNLLFHVDEHSDMITPRFNSSINDLKNDIFNVKEFTYSELNIATFIMPACFKKIFSKVYWIRQKHIKCRKGPIKMFVRSYNQEGKRLISGKIKMLDCSQVDSDSSKFDYFLYTIDQIPSNKKVVLDIDLDYFSCSGNPNDLQEIYVEITQKEYEEFINTNYHRLRYIGIGKIEAVQKEGKFYYALNNYREIYPAATRVENKIIEERINRFIAVLDSAKISPDIIDICRSRYSGYTPSDQWEFIEEKLLEGLNRIYRIDLISFEQLINS